MMGSTALRASACLRWLLPTLAWPLFMATNCVAEANDAAPSSKIVEQLSGTWAMTEESTYRAWLACCDGPGTEVPLTPKYRKIRDDFAKIPADQKPTPNNLAFCITAGVPGTFEHPLMFEFLLTPGRVNLIFHDGSFRRIWTDGRGHPENLTPGYQGHSVGHWEGNTLVVDTRGISKKSDMFIEGYIKTTHRTKVTERMTVRSEKELRVQTTVEDPEVFTRPYTYENVFTKVPIDFEVGCAAENRDTGNQVDLTPPDFED